MKMRTQAKNFALEYLATRGDESREPFAYNDDESVEAVVDDLERALGEEEVRDRVLREIAVAGLKDADRVMSQHAGGVHVQLAQTELFIDYNPDEILVLGDTRRIKLKYARYEHFDLNDGVEVENKIAQDRAFARKMERNRAVKEALRPLDPRTMLGEIVRAPEGD